MARDLKVIAVALVGLCGGAGSAAAQVYPRPPAPIDMPPYEVRTIVRSTGLTPAGPPVRRGQHYVQPALDPYGRAMRVVVDAEVGAVVSIRPAAVSTGPRPMAPYLRYGMAPPRDFDDDDLDMVPPRPVPGVRAPLPAPMTGERPPTAGERVAARPPSTPVPRPRPATAPRDPAVAAVNDPVTTSSVPTETTPVEAAPAAPAAPETPPEPSAALPPVQPLE
jgi:hypothetical protein